MLSKDMLEFIKEIDVNVATNKAKEYIISVGGFNKAMYNIFTNAVRTSPYTANEFLERLTKISADDFIKFLVDKKYYIAYFNGNVHFMFDNDHEYIDDYTSGEMTLKDVAMCVANDLDKY